MLISPDELGRRAETLIPGLQGMDQAVGVSPRSQ